MGFYWMVSGREFEGVWISCDFMRDICRKTDFVLACGVVLADCSRLLMLRGDAIAGGDRLKVGRAGFRGGSAAVTALR